MSERRSIDGILAEARRGLRRVTPAEAYRAAQDGAVLVDVRSEDEQRRQGVILPGALRAIGFSQATDVIGGVDGWREAGLPVEPYPGAG